MPTEVWLTDRTNPDGVPVFGLAWQIVDTAVTPEDKKGKPSEAVPSPKELPSLKSVEVNWTRSDEPFSQFLVDDEYIVKAKPVLTRALLLEGKHDLIGDQVYNLHSNITLNIYAKKAKRLLQSGLTYVISQEERIVLPLPDHGLAILLLQEPQQPLDGLLPPW